MMNDTDSNSSRIRSTTVVCVRLDNQVAMVSDGQVTAGNMVLKSSANKVRKLYDGKVLGGFAGSGVDALALYDRFENKLKEHSGQLDKAAVALSLDWIRDKALKNLQAQLLVADRSQILLINGSGDVLKPDANVMSVGSGSGFALSAAQALLVHQPTLKLSPEQVAIQALNQAASLCIYTNDHICLETLS